MDRPWREGSIEIGTAEFYHSQTNLPNFPIASKPASKPLHPFTKINPIPMGPLSLFQESEKARQYLPKNSTKGLNDYHRWINNLSYPVTSDWIFQSHPKTKIIDTSTLWPQDSVAP